MKSFLRHLALGLLVAGAGVALRLPPRDVPPEPPPPSPEPAVALPAFAPPSSAPGERAIHLNRANTEELEELPGFGPTLARRIVEFRAEHGLFRSPGEVRLVRGIGPKKWERMRGRLAL